MITHKMIRCQLKKDLIGKDVYRGTTQTYTLLANQFGHFALGFIPTAVIYSFIQYGTNHREQLHWPWISVAAIWTIFELFHLQHAVVGHHKKAHQTSHQGFQQFPFQPAWGNIRLDTFTDIGFFCTGALLAGALFLHNTLLLYIFLVLFIPLLLLFGYWYKVKMYLQEAQFPFHYRLSQWIIYISPENGETVKRYLANQQQGQHLLVFGSDIPQKASLCIGLATELAFLQKPCLYLTAMKLLTQFTNQAADSHHSLEQESLWSWRDAGVLIIDDVNPSHENSREVIAASKFSESINHSQFGDLNKEALRKKNVIWVLGHHGDVNHQFEWEDMLCKLGIAREQIHKVLLP
jgi:hypothetical protein